MQKKDWTQISESEESQEDSHESAENNKPQNTSNKNETQNKVEPQKTKQVENVEFRKVRNQRNNEEKKQYKPKDFMTIDALIKQVEGSKVPIKQLCIVFCHHLDEEQIKGKYQMVKGARKYREGSYQINFESVEDVLKFLKEKQANNDKFFIKLSQYQNREPRPARQPKEPRNNYEYNKQYKQSRQQRKQTKYKDKGSYKQKASTKQEPNLFSQNKWVFDEKVTAQQVSASIQNYNLFESFDNMKIVTSQKSQIEKCNVLADRVAKELNLIVKKEIKNDQHRFVLSKNTEVAQQNKIAYSKKEYEPKRHPRDTNKKRKYYLSYNNITMYSQMDFPEIIKQILNKKIFNFYGAIRIKSRADLLPKAKQLSAFICKELNCQQIKEEKKENQHTLIISERKQEQLKSEIKDNKIKIYPGVDVKKMYEEVRNKMNKIFQQFSSIKLEYSPNIEKEAKLLIEEILKLKLAKTNEETKNIEGKVLNIVTFKEKQEASKGTEKQKYQQKQKHKQAQQKQKYKQKQLKPFFDITSTNNVIIDAPFNISNLVSQFQAKRRELYTFYKLFKVQCLRPELFGSVRQLSEELKKHKVVVKEVIKKNEGREILVLEVEEDGKQIVKKKIEVSQINDYLAS